MDQACAASRIAAEASPRNAALGAGRCPDLRRLVAMMRCEGIEPADLYVRLSEPGTQADIPPGVAASMAKISSATPDHPTAGWNASGAQ
jgi:hypothetical protein